MVLILGLGVYIHGSGTAAALYFAKLGVPVVVTDMKSASELNPKTLAKLKKYKNVTFVLGKHRKQDIKYASIIVRNPGIPDSSEFIKYAKQLKKTITNDVEVFLNVVREKFDDQVTIIGITGTRGKSTTTALTGSILQSQFGKAKVHIGGNIGMSPLLFLSKVKKGHIIVLELSSWMLRDIRRPALNIAVLTNVLPDHMDMYSSMSAYRKDKQRIFLGQGATDHAVVNKLDASLRPMVKEVASKLHWYTLKRVSGMQLIGAHNQSNIAAAYTVARIMGVPKTKAERVIKQFKGVPNRLELIRSYKGRTFYNDTTATTPDATIAALNAFKKKVILIAGGNSKQLSLTGLNKEIKKQVKHLILLPGDANKDFPAGDEVKNMKEAVRLAWETSKLGDIILLSPGVTWLPHMNEFDRGKQFVRFVGRLK